MPAEKNDTSGLRRERTNRLPVRSTQAAVLEYACYQGKTLGKLPLKQAGEAMRVLRQRFTDMPAVAGVFSADGHLAAALGVHWKEEGLLKPDGLILCYPVILDQMGYKHQFLPAPVRPLAA